MPTARPSPPRPGPRPPRRTSAAARLLRNLRTLPNQLTFARLAMVPVLWAFALLGRPAWVGVGAGIAATTDMLDGWLSRKWHQTSAFGSRLDSLADHLLAISMVAWLLLLRPEFFLARLWPMLGWSAFALGVLGVSLLRFGRAVDLHLYSAKVAVILAFVFAVPLLVTGRYAPWQFWLTLAAACFAAAEALVVLLTRDRVDEHIGTVLRPSYW
ncbi:MAG TPA: CDP-alcohol phosphatidyltransferase family protein, partial [Longimicrobium sp.]|nr:CDP-alcohol phosphatidyltransferase family protein [Longimicrobium sp.]